MKRISRMVIISACALILTSLWNKGFILPSDTASFFIAVLLLALVIYIIVPLSKIVLLPLNVLSLGLVSFLVYLALLHFSSVSFHVFEVTGWTFPGLKIGPLAVPETDISYFFNLVLSSVSLSSIINVLELLL